MELKWVRCIGTTFYPGTSQPTYQLKVDRPDVTLSCCRSTSSGPNLSPELGCCPSGLYIGLSCSFIKADGYYLLYLPCWEGNGNKTREKKKKPDAKHQLCTYGTDCVQTTGCVGCITKHTAACYFVRADHYNYAVLLALIMLANYWIEPVWARAHQPIISPKINKHVL